MQKERCYKDAEEGLTFPPRRCDIFTYGCTLDAVRVVDHVGDARSSAQACNCHYVIAHPESMEEVIKDYDF